MDVTGIPLRASRQMMAGSFCAAPPQFYSEVGTAGGEMIREHSDGSRELIRIDDKGTRYVERSI